MTNHNPESLIVRYTGTESLNTARGRAKAEAVVESIRHGAPSARCAIRPEGVEASGASAKVVGESLSRSGHIIGSEAEWYLADSDPVTSNLPPSSAFTPDT